MRHVITQSDENVKKGSAREWASCLQGARWARWELSRSVWGCVWTKATKAESSVKVVTETIVCVYTDICGQMRSLLELQHLSDWIAPRLCLVVFHTKQRPKQRWASLHYNATFTSVILIWTVHLRIDFYYLPKAWGTAARLDSHISHPGHLQ